MSRKMKAIQYTTKVEQPKRPHYDINSEHFMIYQRGYKLGWEAAYEKAFNSGLKLGLQLNNDKKQEPASTPVRGEHSPDTKMTDIRMPSAQKELAEILFNFRIKSQKTLIKQQNIVGTEKEFKLMSVSKLKQKCHKLRISAQGNKT
eukprot:131562_1